MSADERPVLFTVGHSDRSGQELVALLKAAAIELVIDVRSHPWSRRYPWHGRGEMEKLLREAGIGYRWLGATLGGLRPDGYQAHRLTEFYRRGLEELAQLARQRRAAILCAEREPWNCHRRYIADDAMRRGLVVRHIIDEDSLVPHQAPLL